MAKTLELQAENDVELIVNLYNGALAVEQFKYGMSRETFLRINKFVTDGFTALENGDEYLVNVERDD